MHVSYDAIAKMIDHSLLKPTLDDTAIEDGIQTALKYNTASVCILPSSLARAAALLDGSTIKPSTTIGFPHGAQTTSTKIAETGDAIQNGAREIDMVVNISKVLSGDWEYVTKEIAAIVSCSHGKGVLLKVIFENCYLETGHKIRLCTLCTDLGCDWIKTSTGFGTGGATIEDIILMRKHAGNNVQIKAAGGIRTLDQLLEAKEAGCTRIGATATVSILDELRRRIDSQ